MADLQAILTATLNAVQAVNNLGQVFLKVNGTTNAPALTGNATLVYNGQSRLASVSVTRPGNATGTIYDSSVTTQTNRPIYTIGNTTGVTVVNFPMNYGIVVVPGNGMTVSVSYSPG